MCRPLKVNHQDIEQVNRFTYLGSVLTDDGDVTNDVNCRLGKATAVFQRMGPIWSSSVISSGTKIWLYKAIVLSVATYVCDRWKITAEVTQKLNANYYTSLIWTTSPTRKS